VRRIIIIFALTIYALAYPQIIECKSSQFVLTCYCGEKKFDICLIGEFPPSKSVNLLSEKSSKTCKGTTLKTFDYTEYPYDSGQPLKMTPLEVKGCEEPGQYTFEQEANNSVVDKVNKTIRDSKLLKESEDFFKTSLLKKPILYRPVSEFKDTYIVQYVIHPYRKAVNYGPLFFYSNNREMKIDSEAEVTMTFKLNGRYFVMFDHSCWDGCGNIYTTLLEIKNNEFIVIFSDSTWAD
jgi:hypothetical protein